jgi:hypothetical protein
MRASVLIGAALLAVSFAATPTQARGPSLDLPDFAALKDKARESVDIDIDRRLLQFAKSIAGEADREAGEVLGGLESVRVRSFEFDVDDAYSVAEIDAVRRQLSAPEWTSFVQVKSQRGQGNVDVFLCLDGKSGEPTGLAVITSEKRQFTIVNIVGRIELDKIGSLVEKWGVGKIDITRR